MADDRRRRGRYQARRIRAGALGGNLLPDAPGAGPASLRPAAHQRRSGSRWPAAAQAAVWSIDRNQAIASIRTVPELLAQRAD